MHENDYLIREIRSVQSGQPISAGFYEQIRYDIYNYTLQTVQDPQLAAALTQDSLNEILGRMHTLQNPAAFVAWSRDIAYRRCAGYFQMQQPAPQPIPRPVQQPVPQPIPQPVQQPVPQPIPQPVQQPVPQPIPQPDRQTVAPAAPKSNTGKKVLVGVLIGVVLLALGALVLLILAGKINLPFLSPEGGTTVPPATSAPPASAAPTQTPAIETEPMITTVPTEAEEIKYLLVDGDDFAAYIPDSVRSIFFIPADIPTNRQLMDLSRYGDGSVVGWLTDDGTEMYVTSFTGGMIYADEDCSYMFADKTKLREVDFQLLDTSEVTSMACMFRNCYSLKYLDLRDWDTSQVTTMNGMFAGSGIEELDLYNFNTANVTDMGAMFASCSNLTALDLGSFDTTNVESMKSMFLECRKLKALNVASFDVSNVVRMDQMFRECDVLQVLDLSTWNPVNLSNASGMFAYSYRLKTIYAKDWTEMVPWQVDGDDMFAECYGLKYFNSSYTDFSMADTDGYFTKK